MLTSKKAKKIAGATIIVLFALFAAVIYNSMESSLYIKKAQIKSVSPDECMFSFETSQNKNVHIIIHPPQTPTEKTLLNSLNDDSVILMKAKGNKLKTGEVISKVWVDGVQISCTPDRDN